MYTVAQDRHSLFLLLSLLLFLVLVPFLEHSQVGDPVLEVMFTMTLIAATLELSDRRVLLWVAIPLVVFSVLVTLFVHFYPARPLLIADHVISSAFFGFVSVGLFTYLGRPGSITRGRLYASVSLYLILGMFWYAIYNLLETINPGSFVQMAPVPLAKIQRGTLLYFSLITLTTAGYGDVLPASGPARMCASLEAVSGVLFIAITVARLVASYQGNSGERA
jgi:voltage-gated potassium channel Kch